MDRGLPTLQFRLRPSHAFYLVDLVLAAVVFLLVGRYYAERRTEKIQHQGDAQHDALAQVIRGRLAQADSVMQATQSQLAAMRADSVARVAELEHKHQVLDQEFVDRQELAQKIFHLSDAVLNMRNQSEEELTKVQSYQQDLAARQDEITGLLQKAQQNDSLLTQITQDRTTAANELRTAYSTRVYEPVGMFPDRSGVVVRREVKQSAALTDFELQHVLKEDRNLDVGVALGVGLGSGDRAASKSLGLLLSRPLVHRRLGLDLGAGYSLLTTEDGSDNGGAYATAGLRLSPFYRERFHLGIGARADHGDVLPYIGISLGRR